jgi:hypothetical protein
LTEALRKRLRATDLAVKVYTQGERDVLTRLLREAESERLGLARDLHVVVKQPNLFGIFDEGFRLAQDPGLEAILDDLGLVWDDVEDKLLEAGRDSLRPVPGKPDHFDFVTRIGRYKFVILLYLNSSHKDLYVAYDGFET